MESPNLAVTISIITSNKNKFAAYFYNLRHQRSLELSQLEKLSSVKMNSLFFIERGLIDDDNAIIAISVLKLLSLEIEDFTREFQKFSFNEDDFLDRTISDKQFQMIFNRQSFEYICQQSQISKPRLERFLLRRLKDGEFMLPFYMLERLCLSAGAKTEEFLRAGNYDYRIRALIKKSDFGVLNDKQIALLKSRYGNKTYWGGEKSPKFVCSGLSEKTGLDKERLLDIFYGRDKAKNMEVAWLLIFAGVSADKFFDNDDLLTIKRTKVISHGNDNELILKRLSDLERKIDFISTFLFKISINLREPKIMDVASMEKLLKRIEDQVVIQNKAVLSQNNFIDATQFRPFKFDDDYRELILEKVSDLPYLAAATGIDFDLLYQYYRGRKLINFEDATLISNCLGLTVAEFVGFRKGGDAV